MRLRRCITAILCCMVAALAVLCLFGCKDSNTLKQIEHSQDATEIDYDSDVVLKVTSPEGEIDNTSNASVQTQDEEASQEDATKPTAEYDKDTKESTDDSSKTKYDNESSNSSDATDAVNPNEGKSGSSKESSGKSSSSSSSTKKTSNSSTSSGNKATANSSGSGADGKESGADSTKDSTQEGDGTSTTHDTEKKGKAESFDTTGKNPQFPDVASVAACGQLAVIVQMVGGADGSSPLTAADAELLDGSFTEVFSKEGSSDIAAAWSTDGETSDDLDIDALVASKPDTVLVTSSDYFTEDQEDALSKAGISYTVVPELTSATRIKYAVTAVGKMLSKATDGVSETRASEYQNFHKQLIDSVLASNGGEGGKSFATSASNTLYDPNDTDIVGKFVSKRYTLLVDEWDFDAYYEGNDNLTGAVSTEGTGMGLSTLGFRSSPVSYYISAAGVVNNAAAIAEGSRTDGRLTPLWQYSNSLGFDLSTVSWSKDGIGGRVYTWKGNGFYTVPLALPNSKASDLSSKGFGSTSFSKVIVGSKKMKEAFKTSTQSENGVYHIYTSSVTDESGVTYTGKKFNGTVMASAILSSVDPDEDVLVNPQGLFSDWKKGSVESCLESAWVSDVFGNTNNSAASWVRDFYKTFYRYEDISDEQVQQILEGPQE